MSEMFLAHPLGSEGQKYMSKMNLWSLLKSRSIMIKNSKIDIEDEIWLLKLSHKII